MNLYTATLQPDGTWTAIWPGGSSKGWASGKQAKAFADSHKPRKKLGLRITR